MMDGTTPDIELDAELVKYFYGYGRNCTDDDLVYQIHAIAHFCCQMRADGVPGSDEAFARAAAERAAYEKILDDRARAGYSYQQPKGGYDRDYIEQVKQRVPILDVIWVRSLRKQGKTFVGFCPFHNERTPSFTVFPETNSYYCFGCGAWGDAINWLRNVNGMDFRGAIEFLEFIAGMPGKPREEVDRERRRLGYPDAVRADPARPRRRTSDAAPFVYHRGEVQAP